MPTIEVKDLRKSYGDVEAVRGVSFSVGRGEVFGLLGPNGAGKTTTVEILEGYRARSAGRGRVLGHDPGARRAAPAARPRPRARRRPRAHLPRRADHGVRPGRAPAGVGRRAVAARARQDR